MKKLIEEKTEAYNYMSSKYPMLRSRNSKMKIREELIREMLEMIISESKIHKRENEILNLIFHNLANLQIPKDEK